MKGFQTRKKGMSMVELLVVIAVIGVIAAIALPALSGLMDSGSKAKNQANAKHLEKMSAALASLGVAHVIPESMGGVEATARLLREGVVVPEGPMAGEQFIMAGLGDEDIAELADYLRVQYDMSELRLVAKNPDQTTVHFESIHLFCKAAPRSPCRIEMLEIDIS